MLFRSGPSRTLRSSGTGSLTVPRVGALTWVQFLLLLLYFSGLQTWISKRCLVLFQIHEAFKNKMSLINIWDKLCKTPIISLLLVSIKHECYVEEMASVFIRHTQQTDTLLISTTVNLQQLVMMRADLLLQVSRGFDQFVPLKGRKFIVRLEVSFTVRHQTHQAGLDSFALSSSSEITRHVYRSSATVSRRSSLESCLLQFLHHFSQHGVFVQNRPRGEGLSALGTAVDTSMIILIPTGLLAAAVLAVYYILVNHYIFYISKS